jgi:CRISPR/Cas system-associated endonuclease Cas1
MGPGALNNLTIVFFPQAPYKGIREVLGPSQRTTNRDNYDPIELVMHYERDRSPAFVFDLMEPERPAVDRAVLAFLKLEALHPTDFTLRQDGVVRLNPGLTSRVTKLVMAL